MFLNAKEIYITYYNESCKDDYLRNIIKIFGEDGLNKFQNEQGLEFIPLSNIERLKDKITTPPIKWSSFEGHGKIEII